MPLGSRKLSVCEPPNTSTRYTPSGPVVAAEKLLKSSQYEMPASGFPARSVTRPVMTDGGVPTLRSTVVLPLTKTKVPKPPEYRGLLALMNTGPLDTEIEYEPSAADVTEGVQQLMETVAPDTGCPNESRTTPDTTDSAAPSVTTAEVAPSTSTGVAPLEYPGADTVTIWAPPDSNPAL